MAVQALSSEDLAALEAALAKLKPAGAEVGAVAADAVSAAGTVETEFCTIWPKAEPILKLVAKYIGFIPGAGSQAGAILNGLVAGGDAISEVVCPKPGQ
jgi:hypothetical protein